MEAYFELPGNGIGKITEWFKRKTVVDNRFGRTSGIGTVPRNYTADMESVPINIADDLLLISDALRDPRPLFKVFMAASTQKFLFL